MNESASQKFVDHPAPGIGLFSLFMVIIAVLAAAFPAVLADISKENVPAVIVWGVFSVLGLSFAVLCFYLWPLYTTYYILDARGITVKYGPWTHVSRWSDFKTVYWQKGIFITKIGWPSINPCVRLSNGLVLPRKHKMWGLYITPNDPEAFIRKIEFFAPELTKEMIR